MNSNAAKMYCHKKFRKSLDGVVGKKEVYQSFEALEKEIQKLDLVTQINLYSAVTQFLDSLIQEPTDSINPLEVFNLRCNSILGSKYNANYKIVLGLAVIALSIATVITGGALGIGIGVLYGLWQTPLMFMTSLFAAEAAAVGVAAFSATVGIGVGGLTSYLFFKEPKIKTHLTACIETVKESYLYNPENEEKGDHESQLSEEVTTGFNTTN